MKELSYRGAGVDIEAADAAKRRMSRSVDSDDPRVLNQLGAFASVVEARFSGITDPVLVLKTEEPGSKQELALSLNRIEGICKDLIHHLVNDVAVMGAHPAYVLDCIVCGALNAEVVEQLVAGMAEACRVQGCVLVGGETSVQPGVLPDGAHVLSATAVGVAERSEVLDGSRIRPGDVLLAVASNGFHTNGYTLIRALLRAKPQLAEVQVEGEPFLDIVMRPHTAYYPALKGLFGDESVRGFAHVTGGGVRDNVARILPEATNANVQLAHFRVPPVFGLVREEGGISDEDMLRTFNLGCGLVVVCDNGEVDSVKDHLSGQQLQSWEIGRITNGNRQVVFTGEIHW